MDRQAYIYLKPNYPSILFGQDVSVFYKRFLMFFRLPHHMIADVFHAARILKSIQDDITAERTSYRCRMEANQEFSDSKVVARRGEVFFRCRER